MKKADNSSRLSDRDLIMRSGGEASVIVEAVALNENTSDGIELRQVGVFAGLVEVSQHRTVKFAIDQIMSAPVDWEWQISLSVGGFKVSESVGDH